MRILTGSDRRDHGSPPYPAPLTRSRTTPVGSLRCAMVAVLTSSATEPTRSSRTRSGRPRRPHRSSLRLPAFLASAHLTFDDGVFGASAVAMRAGGQPYRDVFSSQGPLFLPLVWVADLAGLPHRRTAPRLLSLAAALAARRRHLPAAGRVVTDRGGALLAAGLVSVTATSLWITGPLAADGAALAFATATMAMVLRWRRRRHRAPGVWIGLGIGATISVKALLAPVIVPAALVLLAGRRLAPILAGAATAIGFHLLLWLPWGLGERVGRSRTATTSRSPPIGRPGANLAKVLSTMGDRDAIVLAAAVLAIGAVALRPASRRPARRARLDLARRAAPRVGGRHRRGAPGRAPDVAPARVAARPGPRPPGRPPPPVVAGPRGGRGRAAPLLPGRTPGPCCTPTPYRGSAAEAVDLLRTLPDGALAISDEPGLVWRSGHRTPPDLVDASVLRIETGDITERSRSPRRPPTPTCARSSCASGERWGCFDDLPDRLADAGYEVAAEDGEVRRVYLKPDCRPTT